MKNKMLRSALAMGAMMISLSSFAELKVEKKANGKASMTPISNNSYYLTCYGSGKCYTLYTSGDMVIHLSGGDVFCRPALDEQPPVLIPDPTNPDTYTMIGSMKVELLPGQQVAPGDN